MRYLFLFIAGLFFSFSCTNDASSNNTATSTAPQKKIDYEIVSQEICDCVDPLSKLNKEIEFLVKTERKDKAMEMLKDVQAKQDELEDCIEALEKKYSSEDIVENDKMFSYLKKKCPTTAEYLSGE